jgi:hypothetical protein
VSSGRIVQEFLLQEIPGIVAMLDKKAVTRKRSRWEKISTCLEVGEDLDLSRGGRRSRPVSRWEKISTCLEVGEDLDPY